MLLAGDLVLIGTDDGEGHIYAFEQTTGKVRWKYAAGRGVSTDILRDGDRVYAVTLEDELVCLDLATGKLLWSVATGAEPPGRFTMGSTPAVVERRVYFGGLDGMVRALDADTGREAWKTRVGDQVVTSTLALGDRIVVGTRDARIHALDRRTGASIAAVTVGEPPRGHLVPLDDGGFCVYLAGDMWRGELAVFDSTLAQVWSAAPPDSSTWTAARPFVLGEGVLAGSQAGLLCMIDTATGSVVWSHAVDPERDWTDDGVRIVGANRSTLYVGTISGALYAFTTYTRG